MKVGFVHCIVLMAHNRILLSIFVLGENLVVLIVSVNNKAIICIVFILVFPCVGNKCLIVVYSNKVYLLKHLNEIYFMDFSLS